MRLFDTHCHFETTDADEISAVLARAKAAGVERLVAVGGSPALNDAALAAAGLANDVLYAVGFDRDQIHQSPTHPPTHPLTQSNNQTIKQSNNQTLSPAAWGEIGLDYHYSPETRREQRELFASQLEEARRRDLPVIIHTREAADDTLALLREIPSRGVIHCFTGNPDEARAYLDLGFFISISGIVTFKAADNVRESALVVPDDRVLIETDSPFLAPVPMRGNKNEPAFVKYTCEFLAKLRGMAPEDFAELTFANAERVFG